MKEPYRFVIVIENPNNSFGRCKTQDLREADLIVTVRTKKLLCGLVKNQLFLNKDREGFFDSFRNNLTMKNLITVMGTAERVLRS